MRFGALAKSLQDSGFKATGACPAETEGSRFVEGHERFCVSKRNWLLPGDWVVFAQLLQARLLLRR